VSPVPSLRKQRAPSMEYMLGHKDMLCDPDISTRPFYVTIYIYPCPLLLKGIPVYSDSRLVDIVRSTLLW
jgi:hypothetical protein